MSFAIPSLIDDNWHLDEVFKLSRGIWIGRDVAFTHGPIFQWLSNLPARSMGVSMGAIYATCFTVPVWFAFAFVYLTLRLLLPEQPAWKRALLLLLILVFWEPSLRNAFPVFLFAIFLRGWYAVIPGRAKTYVLGIVAALLCVIAFLVASDTGVYSTAAWVVATAAVVFEARRDKLIAGKCLLTMMAFVVSAFVLALAVNAAMGRTFDFRFWKDSAQMVSVYRWATPAAMTDAGTVRLLGTLFAGAAVFLFRAGAHSKQSPATTERTGFLLGGFAFAVVMLQSALVRSDLGHVVIAAFAMVCLSGVILFSFESGGFSAFAVLLAIACSVLPPGVPALYGHSSGSAGAASSDRMSGWFPRIRPRMLCPGIHRHASVGLQLSRPAQRCARPHRRLPLPDEIWHSLAPRCRRRLDAGLHRKWSVLVPA
ncbi:MAG TPA: hypothetical protein VKG65_03175 [Terriglobales bacterium]|nr:hypothetical protein [Terriglobales bacterium]